MNCSDRSLFAWKKRLHFEVNTRKKENCLNEFYDVFVQGQSEFPDLFIMISGQPSHAHLVLKPIIHTFDENLRSLSPKQWVHWRFVCLYIHSAVVLQEKLLLGRWTQAEVLQEILQEKLRTWMHFKRNFGDLWLRPVLFYSWDLKKTSHTIKAKLSRFEFSFKVISHRRSAIKSSMSLALTK